MGRYSGEQQDSAAGGDSNTAVETNADGDPVDVDGVPMLSLHEEEREVIRLAKQSGAFKKIIVLLNTGTSMDVGELEELGVDACLWIGYPGYTGFEGVANILAGDADPSGRLVDTYATDSLSSPAMRNYGNFSFSNVTTMSQDHYLVYAEGIYLGYKYYETRYADQVRGINNATSSKGVYASENNSWDYADEMVYTFGHGESYASFEETLTSLEWDRENSTVTATVHVENLGVDDGNTYTGASKDVVELYVSLPYESGQAEKSAIQLIGFAKTEALEPGEETDVTITVDDYLFTTYDENAINGADTSLKGCYVFDEGDYAFAIGDDAHDALNNVLASQNVTGLFDAEGNSVAGDTSKVEIITLNELDNTSHARSDETGEIVSNQFEDLDLNEYIDNAVNYLTRDDWNTYPDRIENITATDEMLELLDGHTYQTPADAPSYSDFNYSVTYTDENGEEDPIVLAEMRDVDYDDDEAWDAFIDQLTPSELASLSGEAFGMPAYSKVGAPSITSADGPDGIQANAGFSHVCENLACSTWNVELLEARGKFMAEDGMASGQSGVYGFGANMHRTPYGGRNFEYYSEDTTMSYLAGAAQTKAATEKGLTTYVKHFCANDQEAWRNGCATMMTEQAYRQGPLKAFEGSFTKGGSLGTMTSNARVGLTTVSMHYATMTTVLRDEWGFKGVAMTDSSKGSTHYLYTAESIAAGIDQFNNDETRGTVDMKNYLISERDGYLWSKSREIAKHYFYMLARNFVMADVTEDDVIEDSIPWWQPTIYAILGVLGAATAAMVVLTVISYVQERKKRA